MATMVLAGVGVRPPPDLRQCCSTSTKNVPGRLLVPCTRSNPSLTNRYSLWSRYRLPKRLACCPLNHACGRDLQGPHIRCQDLWETLRLLGEPAPFCAERDSSLNHHADEGVGNRSFFGLNVGCGANVATCCGTAAFWFVAMLNDSHVNNPANSQFYATQLWNRVLSAAHGLYIL